MEKQGKIFDKLQDILVEIFAMIKEYDLNANNENHITSKMWVIGKGGYIFYLTKKSMHEVGPSKSSAFEYLAHRI